MTQPSTAVVRSDETSAEPPRVETIEELFAALESPLLSYAHRLVKDVEVVEDLVQEAFMKLHADFDQIREPRRWLFRTLHNQALNHQRRANKIVSLDQSAHDGVSLSAEIADPKLLPDEQLTHLENIGLVQISLETLDYRSRELVRLKFNEGLSYKEISTLTGLAVGHVGYLLHHALKAIAADVSRMEGIR